jgi:hypothetical protein
MLGRVIKKLLLGTLLRVVTQLRAGTAPTPSWLSMYYVMGVLH